MISMLIIYLEQKKEVKFVAVTVGDMKTSVFMVENLSWIKLPCGKSRQIILLFTLI